MREEQIELVVIEFDPFIVCLTPLSSLTCWSLKSVLLNKKPNNYKIGYCFQPKFNLNRALSCPDKFKWWPPQFLHNCPLLGSAGEILSSLNHMGVGIRIAKRFYSHYDGAMEKSTWPNLAIGNNFYPNLWHCYHLWSQLNRCACYVHKNTAHKNDCFFQAFRH